MTIGIMRTGVHDVDRAYRLLSQFGRADETPVSGDEITRLRSDLKRCKQMPQTVSSLRNKLKCEMEFLATEFYGAAHLDAHRAGGRVLAKATFLYGTVKVAVIANKDGSLRTLAISLGKHGWQLERDTTILKPFVEATIHLAVVDALKREVLRSHGLTVGEGHLEDAGFVEKVTEAVLRGVAPWKAARDIVQGNKKTATVGQ